MAKPTCPKCNNTEFSYEYQNGVCGDAVYIIFCKKCGYIIGCAAAGS